MEALAVFGIACNVMQTISFSLEVLSMCRRISEKGTPQPDLETNSGQLQQLSTALLENINEARMLGTVSKEQRTLRDVATSLNDTIAQLATLLDDIKMSVPSRRGAIKSMLKYKFRHKRKIEELDKTMRNYQRTLNSGILAHICSTTEANALLSRQDFSNLDSTLQSFIQQYAQDTRNLTDHVSKESRLVTENLQIRSREQAAHDQHARFLDSLKFEEMNSRRSAVTVAHAKTFGWIFDTSIVRHWDSFPQWLNSSSKDMYWISGKPGSGKSTLMKFIIANDATKQALVDQEPHAKILSYFFWTSGTKMQRSIKGMLSSLLHQLLRVDEEMISRLSKQGEKIQYKDSIHDWSVEELEHTLLDVFSNLSQITCLFIDGLDEVDSAEGQDALLQVLERVRMQPNVKLCVSSRPETILRQSLEMYPKLRLQDLTKEDMRCMVQDTLDPAAELLAKIKPNNDGVDIAWRILLKADGVFLWAALVTRSVYQGIRKGDDWKTLLKRLDILPGDMNSLYKHMWSRLNEDKPLYQVQAANYFSYLLHVSNYTHGSRLRTQSLYQVMVASERSFDNHVFQENTTKLPELCESVAKRISVRCAGMLEFIWEKEDEDTTLPAGETAKETWRTLGVHPTKVFVCFIHRSAEDFLRYTEDGKEILGFCSKFDEEIYSDLARGLIAQSTFYQGLQTIQSQKFGLVDIIPSLEDLYTFCGIVVSYKTNLSQDAEIALLHLYRKSLEYLERGGPSLRFLKLIAMFGLHSFFCHLVQDREMQYHTQVDEYKTQILQCAAYWEERHGGIEDFYKPIFMLGKLQLIEHLLEVGADLNATFWSASRHYGSIQRTALSSTLRGLFLIFHGLQIEYEEAFHGLAARRLQIFPKFTRDFHSKTVLFCYMKTEISTRLRIHSTWDDYFISHNPFVVIEVNCAWLWRGLMEMLAPKKEKASIIGDSGVEPEIRIVQVFLDSKQRLTESKLERLVKGDNILQHLEGNELESRLKEILSSVSKSNHDHAEGEIVEQPCHDWVYEKGYNSRGTGDSGSSGSGYSDSSYSDSEENESEDEEELAPRN